jgi:hypothetical protein
MILFGTGLVLGPGSQVRFIKRWSSHQQCGTKPSTGVIGGRSAGNKNLVAGTALQRPSHLGRRSSATTVCFTSSTNRLVPVQLATLQETSWRIAFIIKWPGGPRASAGTSRIAAVSSPEPGNKTGIGSHGLSGAHPRCDHNDAK